ncbi:hypothetical protein WOLCODRAFT_156300 [Wolfiporia cocos MD-104 SS10]|uniref:Uncharacterized protein n=1 Tax=Wolfiporia cocos (strain MD-104) TaxID=742152 RepID=A0A2H3JA31_WOLCO|nr:hypothetical protein WOLCODRAFT_156300 [Wolfiporia cocos MD-104 SS10]
MSKRKPRRPSLVTALSDLELSHECCAFRDTWSSSSSPPSSTLFCIFRPRLGLMPPLEGPSIAATPGKLSTGPFNTSTG